MIESVGKLLVDPLAERWKGAAIGGGVLLWLFIGALVLFTRQGTPANWPVDCGSAAHTRPEWCSVASADKTTILAVGAVAAVIGTAFLAQGLAPFVLNLSRGESWMSWPVVGFLARKTQWRRSGAHSLSYPNSLFPGGLRPTRIGNRFAALAQQADFRFGFELDIVWETLVASLPPEPREKLVSKSQSLMLAAQHLLLGVVAPVAAVLIIPRGWARLIVPLIALMVARGLWQALVAAVDDYCDLVLTTLALHYGALYTALGETPPGIDENLRARGTQLTGKIRFLFHRVSLAETVEADQSRAG
jgi:hypothetical protein